MASSNVTSLSFNFYIKLRDCIRGEYFTAAGKCIMCAADQGYSLSLMTSPGNCVPCPTQEAYCEGGANIAPRPGYWRSSNISSDFIQCYNPSACLGWYPLTPNEYYPDG